MTNAHTNEQTPRKPLRLWPGVVIVILQWLIAFGLPLVAPDAEVFSVPVGLITVLGGVVGGLAIALWWVCFSRARWSERVGAILLAIVAVAATKLVVHESIAGAAMGMLLYLSSFPFVSLALVAWALATRHVSNAPRRAALLVAAIVLACAPWALLRTGGVGGSGSELHWRWTPTPEQLLLARANDEPKALPPAAAPAETPKPSVTPALAETPAARPERTATPTAESVSAAATETPAEWPGFRGPHRDGVVHGARIETDWSKSPPVEVWRRPIGPGWSSFAVHGDLFYTQEQRGDREVVSCYRLTTGEPVWRHGDAARFWESNAGAGPRATPALSNGRVYTFGATGILNALDARTGAVVWSRNAAADTGVEIPGWGFSSSPLVVDDVVVVATSGRLAAYEAASGRQRWLGPTGGAGYSSPHLVTIDGAPQILLLRGSRSTSVAPADGTLLWEHKAEPGVSILQPALAADRDVLIAAGDMMGGTGIRRLAIARGPAGWTVEERWSSRGLKPYFNDFVVHKGYAFGFDGTILACIDIADGQRKWKGGRYGQGQLVLLPDQDVLLVLSEEGELALIRATPDQFTEIARFPAIEGKTWNHPVLVGNLLLVRNDREMAAFRLSHAGR